MFMASLFGSSLNAGESYKFQELQSIALGNNPQIKAIFNEWKAVVSEITASRSLQDPKISYSEFIEEVQTRVGPQNRKISFSQMFPWFGTLKLRGKITSTKAEIVEQKLENTKLNIVNELKKTLYDLILLDRKIQIYVDHLDLLNGIELSAKGHLKSGKGHLSNVLKTQVERERLIDSLSTLKALKTPYEKKLEKVLGLKINKSLPAIVQPNLVNLNKAFLITEFKKNNPKWLANNKSQTMGQYSIDLAKKSGKPSFGVGIGWIDTGEAFMPNTKGSGDDPLALTLSLSVPLWRAKVNSKINKAKYNYQSSIEEGKSIIDNFESELEIILFRVKDSKRKKELYSKILLPKVKDAYKSTNNAYVAGKVSFQNLLDAERLVLRISLDYEISINSHYKAYADLNKIIGTIGVINEQ